MTSCCCRGAIAEYERAVLGERFRRGKLQKARDGITLVAEPQIERTGWTSDLCLWGRHQKQDSFGTWPISLGQG